MNTLLIFFALPIAVIIISIALQKILKCPSLVAAIIFAIFLIVTFIVNNLNFLVAAIVYAIISFITAYITCIVGRLLDRIGSGNTGCCRRERENTSCCRRENECSCNNNNLLTIRNLQNEDQNNNGNCIREGCTYQITNADGLSARINIIPNSNNTNTNTNGSNYCCRRR